jgi:transcriptional regulator with XRE-family HTH domain
MSNPKKYLSLGEKIKKARKEIGYSQKQFGEALQLSDKAISAYEVDRAEPTISTLKNISKITHRPASYFLEDSNTEDLDLQIKIKTIERELLEIKNLLKKRATSST